MTILSSASYIRNSIPKLRGKVSKFIANKCAIAAKIDAGNPSKENSKKYAS